MMLKYIFLDYNGVFRKGLPIGMDCSSTEYDSMEGLTNKDMDTENQNLQASFRVIGVGNGIEDVINRVKSFEFDCVSAEIATHPFKCTPTEEDNLAIIVFTDCDDKANRIANIFHDAGVLTIGFSKDADPHCYDSVMLCDNRME